MILDHSNYNFWELVEVSLTLLVIFIANMLSILYMFLGVMIVKEMGVFNFFDIAIRYFSVEHNTFIRYPKRIHTENF